MYLFRIHVCRVINLHNVCLKKYKYRYKSTLLRNIAKMKLMSEIKSQSYNNI